jgi:hypothetical protein
MDSGVTTFPGWDAPRKTGFGESTILTRQQLADFQYQSLHTFVSSIDLSAVGLGD